MFLCWLFGIFVLIVLTPMCTADVNIAIKTVHVQEGGQIAIICTSRIEDDVTWKHKDKDVEQLKSFDSRYSNTKSPPFGSEVTSTLVILDAKPDDAGTVECADKKEPYTDKSSAIIIVLKHGQSNSTASFTASYSHCVLLIGAWIVGARHL